MAYSGTAVTAVTNKGCDATPTQSGKRMPSTRGPSPRTIQGILARLGDKPPSFVGSSNWIGAIELSYVLDDYLGVTCKVRMGGTAETGWSAGCSAGYLLLSRC